MDKSEPLTLDEAVMKARCAFVMNSLRYDDLFAILEVALKTINELQNRVTKLEKNN